MDQQSLLRLAKRELGFSYPQLASAMGVSARTMDKWALVAESGDHRSMPLMARKLLVHLLAERKRRHLAAGDRASTERIDAISAQADPAVLRESLRAFDSLQRSADSIAPMAAEPDKPRYFHSPAEKNAWDEQQALRNARRTRAKSARGR